MSYTAVFVILLFIASVTLLYVMKRKSFVDRDPIVIITIPFFAILFMVAYVMMISMQTNVERIFLPIH